MKRLELTGRRGETDALGTSGRFAFHERSDRDDSETLVTSAINRSLLAGAGVARTAALTGILVTNSSRSRRRALAIVFREEVEVIGCDGGPGSDEEEDGELLDGDDDELAEPSEILTPEERAFLNLTKRNTDFNSINSNLTGTSRTLVDWVDDNDRTTERSALTGRHKKFTPVVSVAPFSTGRGPGPLKINPVAPMQNGEVLSTGRIQEMVEKRSASDRAIRREQQITRLDDKVTRLDGNEDMITRLDDKDGEVTRFDDNVLKSEEKMEGRGAELDKKAIGQEDERSSSEGDASVSKKVGDERSAKTKTISAVKSSDMQSSINTESKSTRECSSQTKAQLSSRVSSSGNPELLKPEHRRTAADRSSSTARESSDVETETAPSDPPMSNIDMIKARLAEKAAQNGPSSWRSPGKHPERNRARLNSLDGVPKSPKMRTQRTSTEVSPGDEAPSKADSVSSKSLRAAELVVTAESRTPACDRVTQPSASEPTGDGCKNAPSTGSGTERQHLSDEDRSTDTIGAESAAATTGDEEKLADMGVKPAPGDHKPPIVNDKPKLAAKPGKVKASGQLTGWDGAERRSNREDGDVQPTHKAHNITENLVKTGMGNTSRYSLEMDTEKLALNFSERPTEPDKLSSRLAEGQNNELMSDDLPAEDSNSKSSYSPKTIMQKHIEPKTSVVETKTQRAIKREKELERQREELEKKNREEKRASALNESGRTERHRTSATLPDQEPSATNTRRTSPPSVDVPHPLHASSSNDSGLYAQIHQADRRRISRDAGPPRPAPQSSPASETRTEPLQPEPTASQRSSFSTDDDDDDEDEPPAPPQRTVSVSPRSRRKRGGVSFAPDTEDRSSGVKPRSQSMPRPGALEQHLTRDQEVRDRLSGGGSEERRSRRDEPRSRARFSLKKFLKFGRDEKRKERDQVYGEFRAKPEIIHPIDRAGVGCVQVIGRPHELRRRREEADQRRGRDRPAQDGSAGHDSPSAAVSPRQTPPRLPERQSHPSHPTHPSHTAHHGQASHRISSGLTPEGRPKPPPPPPPSCRQSGDLLTPPSRPPPPNPHLLSRSRDGWARPPDSDYANLGVSRAGLTPKKPGRGARSRERADTSSDHQRPARLQADGSQAAQDGLRRQQPCRLSLREASACVPPASLADSYDAVTASNRQALRQLWEQMWGAVPAALLPLQAAPLSLRDFQLSPRSLLPVGRHMFVEAVHGGRPVALCVTGGPMAGQPLSVPAVADFTDSVPTRLLAGPHREDGSQAIGTVHVMPAARVRPLSALLADPPSVTSHRDRLLLLLQTVRQLQLLAAAGQPAVDEQLSQLVALTADWLPQPRLAAVLGAPGESAAEGVLSPCLASLSVLLCLLGVPGAVQRAADGRGLSSVPDGPQVTELELLASLLQRDDDASLRRTAAVLGCLLWAPDSLAPAEAPRWLHRQRAAVLGAAVRSQSLAGTELLRLGFLADTEPETVADALQLIDI